MPLRFARHRDAEVIESLRLQRGRAGSVSSMAQALEIPIRSFASVAPKIGFRRATPRSSGCRDQFYRNAEGPSPWVRPSAKYYQAWIEHYKHKKKVMEECTSLLADECENSISTIDSQPEGSVLEIENPYIEEVDLHRKAEGSSARERLSSQDVEGQSTDPDDGNLVRLLEDFFLSEFFLEVPDEVPESIRLPGRDDDRDAPARPEGDDGTDSGGCGIDDSFVSCSSRRVRNYPRSDGDFFRDNELAARIEAMASEADAEFERLRPRSSRAAELLGIFDGRPDDRRDQEDAPSAEPVSDPELSFRSSLCSTDVSTATGSHDASHAKGQPRTATSQGASTGRPPSIYLSWKNKPVF